MPNRVALPRFIWSALLRLFPHRDLSGIRLIFTDVEVDRAAATAGLRDAIALLETSDPRRARWLSRYVQSVVIWAGHYSFATSPGRITLASRVLTVCNTLELASILVHETTHLRIDRHGIPYDAVLRARIERRCTLEQAAFLRRHGPEGQKIADAYLEQLEEPWWTEEADRADVERVIADVGIPEWIARWIRR